MHLLHAPSRHRPRWMFPVEPEVSPFLTTCRVQGTWQREPRDSAGMSWTTYRSSYVFRHQLAVPVPNYIVQYCVEYECLPCVGKCFVLHPSCFLSSPVEFVLVPLAYVHSIPLIHSKGPRRSAGGGKRGGRSRLPPKDVIFRWFMYIPSPPVTQYS